MKLLPRDHTLAAAAPPVRFDVAAPAAGPCKQVTDWSRDGRELLFVDAEGILQSVAITTEGGFRAGRPAPLFELGAFETDGYHYAVSRDGTRCLVMRVSAKAALPALKVIMNWRPGSQ